MQLTNPRRAAWAASGGVTAVWAIALSVAGIWERVIERWAAGVTMVFGSFISGASPAGGGAVAFPVFTKALDVPASVARTFGLSIQSVGMTMAVLSIVLYRRPVEGRAVLLATPVAMVGFVVGLFAFGLPDEVFWPTRFSSGWVKAMFSVVLASTAILMIRQLRPGVATASGVGWTGRATATFVAAAFAGGLLSALAGTGANIMVFLVLVVVVGIDPKRALPTSIVVMAAVSLTGLVALGLFDGQLDVVVEAGRVIEVGGTITDTPAAQTDLLGLWLAAVPVVAWGAPLGSWAAARVRPQVLVGFVAALTLFEVLTTLVLVDELRDNLAMMLTMAVGLVLFPSALIWLGRGRPGHRADVNPPAAD